MVVRGQGDMAVEARVMRQGEHGATEVRIGCYVSKSNQIKSNQIKFKDGQYVPVANFFSSRSKYLQALHL